MVTASGRLIAPVCLVAAWIRACGATQPSNAAVALDFTADRFHNGRIVPENR